MLQIKYPEPRQRFEISIIFDFLHLIPDKEACPTMAWVYPKSMLRLFCPHGEPIVAMQKPFQLIVFSGLDAFNQEKFSLNFL